MPRRITPQNTMFGDPLSIELPDKPHRVVAAWIESDRQAEATARKEHRQPRAKDEDTVAGRRKLRICDALFKAANAKGYSWTYQGDCVTAVWLNINDRSIRWSVREQTSPRRVPLSKAELREPHHIANGVTTKEIRVPTGMLKIIASTDFGKKTQIVESPSQPFEQRIDELFERFSALADAANTHEVKLAQWQHDYEIKKRDRERVRRLNVMEDARWDHLRELNSDWREAKQLRSFIDTVERELRDSGQSQRAIGWLKWARDRADWLDPLSGWYGSAQEIVNWRYCPRPSEYELTIWDLN